MAVAAGAVLGFLGARLAARPAQPEPAPGDTVVSGDTVIPQPEEPTEEQEAPPPAPVRIGMEDVVSELERRYQGRQAEGGAEKRAGTRRRRRS